MSVIAHVPIIFVFGFVYSRKQFTAHNSIIFSNKETKIVRICLHSTVEPIMSELAMQPLKSNVRKIILATNMAESSITVPDVKYGRLPFIHFYKMMIR